MEGVGIEGGEVEEEVQRRSGKILWLRMKLGERKWGARVRQKPK